jgi:hypothetical protein
VELDDLADLYSVTDCECSAASIDTQQRTDEEVALFERLDLFIGNDPDVQAFGCQGTILGGKRVDRRLQPLDRDLTSELPYHLPGPVGDHPRRTDRPAPLAYDRLGTTGLENDANRAVIVK